MDVLQHVGALDADRLGQVALSTHALSAHDLNGNGRQAMAIAARRSPRIRSRALRVGLILSDAVAIVTAFLVTQFGVSAFEPHELSITGFLAFGLLGWFVLANAQGLYDSPEVAVGRSALDDLPALVLLTGFAAWIGLVLVNAVGLASPRLGVAVSFWGLAIALIAGGRSIVRVLVRRASLRERTLIVGSGRVARRIAHKLESRPKYGLEFVGFLDDDPFELDVCDPGYLGSTDRLEEVVHAREIERVIVAFSLLSGERQVDLLRRSMEVGVRIEVVPRMYEVIGSRSRMHDIDGIPLMSLNSTELSGLSRALKRGMDIVLASSLLLVLAPLFAFIACRIRLESPGPVFFRQERMGAGGKRFEMLKFRSMHVDADQRKCGLHHLNKHVEEGPRMFKVADDPRVTSFGRFLRKSSLDELPQLINVVRGQMSLVGPRPLILDEDENILGYRRSRLRLTPGVTGLWQVLGRSDIPFAEMLMLDYLYVTNWSLWGDVKLLLRTVPAVLTRRGAY